MARHWKGQKRDQNREIDLAQQIEDSFRQVDDWLVASHTSPSMAVHGKEILVHLAAAVEELPEKLRKVVVMYHLQGMTLVQIANEVGCDETTAGRRLFRGVKKLGSIMNDQNGN